MDQRVDHITYLFADLLRLALLPLFCLAFGALLGPSVLIWAWQSSTNQSGRLLTSLFIEPSGSAVEAIVQSMGESAVSVCRELGGSTTIASPKPCASFSHV